MSDNKYYLNLYQRIADNAIIHLLQVGLNGFNRKDIYVFDPRIRKQVHFSLHDDGVVHIRTGKLHEKVKLFKTDWFQEREGLELKKMIYFRPAKSGRYPLLAKPLGTDKTIDHEIILRNPNGSIYTKSDFVIKIFLGRPNPNFTEEKITEDGSPIDCFDNPNWTLGVSTMPLGYSLEYDTGAFLFLFNTSEDVPDANLFKTPFEMGTKTDTMKFIVSSRTFDQGEVSCIYYRT